MSVVEEVKQKTDIVEVIGQYTALTKSGKTFRGLCPFHSEKHGSFFVYPDQQSWHCFGACGTGGDVFSFIMKKDGVTFGDALRLLAEKSGVVIPQYAAAEKTREKHDRLYQANQAAAEYYHQLLLSSPEAQKVRDYLAQRGLNAQSVEDFKLGYSPNAWDNLQRYLLERGFTIAELLEAGLVVEGDNKMQHDRFRHRLMFPITDIRGRVIGFGGRALAEDQQPKYLNSPQTPLFDKSSNLYGLHPARDAMRKEEQAVIVEGYMDVILPHQYGFKNVIASMGTAIGENHTAILKKMTKNLVLALDPDSTGEAATLRSVGLENSLGAEIQVAILPEGKDPDEIVKENAAEWQSLIAGAIPILDYTFERATAGLDLKTAKGKTDAVEKLMPIVGQIKDVVRQTYYIDKLAGLVGQSPKKLELLLLKNKGAQRAKTSTQEAGKSSVSSPVEEYCLTVILKHPELREQYGDLLPEFFDSSENREVYNAILGCDDISQVRASLDSALWEHYDRLVGRILLTNKMEAKLADAVLRLREEHLKRQAQNRADTLAVDEGNQLRELFVKKEHLGEEKRRQK
ncbi:MAG: DNA primase [Dehalococcoidia bacterium]|nr:MAG: DNA primase [Dehalococcoidia bacterium]